MAANNTSSNDSLPPPHLPSWPELSLNMHCFVNSPTSIVFLIFTITNFLLLFPLCTFILHRGFQRWMKIHSTSSPSTSSPSSSGAAPMSHFEVFTYHMVVMELVRVFGGVLCCLGVLSETTNMLLAGTLLLFFTWYGQLFFQVITCVERHLAVVHPVTYLKLRTKRGVRIRNVASGCVWLLCLVKVGLLKFEMVFVATDLCLFILTIMVVSFSSLRVLRVLLRPGPGEQGESRERVDQSKQRAFYTILTILGVLVLRFSWNVVWAVLHMFGGSAYCVTVVCEIWVNLSNSLVPPFLFLQREGKLTCWRKTVH